MGSPAATFGAHIATATRVDGNETQTPLFFPDAYHIDRRTDAMTEGAHRRPRIRID